MNFYKVKDLAKSWSVWAASAVAVTPVLDMSTGLFSFIPEKYKPLAVTALGALTIVLRAIKQVHTVFSTGENDVAKTANEILGAKEAEVREATAKIEKAAKDIEQVVDVAKQAKDVVKAIKAKAGK